MQEFQYVCDGCGDVVHGKVKAAFVHKDYFQIKGQMVMQLMDLKSRYKEHVFLTKAPLEELTFCLTPDLKCLYSYMSMRKDKYYFNKRLKLQKEAEGEHVKRKELEPEFLIGHKRDDGKWSRR